MKKHLAIMNKPTIEAILNGQKTIETRFSKHRIVPFGLVSTGDLVYMKPPGDEIKGVFRVKKVFFYEGLTEEDLKSIFREYGARISMGDKIQNEKYLQDKMNSYYGTLIFITGSERLITSPIRFKKKDQRGWVVLG